MVFASSSFIFKDSSFVSSSFYAVDLESSPSARCCLAFGDGDSVEVFGRVREGAIWSGEPHVQQRRRSSRKSCDQVHDLPLLHPDSVR